MDSKQQKESIRLFLSNVVQKNYAEANKYLRSALQHKMMSRVKDSAKNLGFK